MRGPGGRRRPRNPTRATCKSSRQAAFDERGWPPPRNSVECGNPHADEEAPRCGATLEQDLANQVLSQRRLRIEHVNSSVKRCRIVKDRIRLWKQGVRDLVMEL